MTQEMSKDECVNALKHMAAHKYLGLLHVEKYGLKDSTSLSKKQFVAVESSQFRALKAAIFHISGEHFNTEELKDSFEKQTDSKPPEGDVEFTSEQVFDLLDGEMTVADLCAKMGTTDDGRMRRMLGLLLQAGKVVRRQKVNKKFYFLWRKKEGQDGQERKT